MGRKAERGQRRFLWRPGGTGGEEKGGRGSGVRRRVEGKMGGGEGAPGVAGTGRAGGIVPRPAGTGCAIAA
jgi:hypothetical protein